MKSFVTPLATFSFVLLLACDSFPLVGQTPPMEKTANGQEPCVLLRNQNVLFGVATQQGSNVIIVRGDSSEIHMPRSKVLYWGNSLRDLYRYRTDQREHDNPNAHLEDARWCLRYGLYDLTARELLQVYRAEPNNESAKRVEQELRRRITAAEQESQSRAKLASTDGVVGHPGITPSEVVTTSHSEPAKETAEFRPQMIHTFARDVQPILANRCGQCHNTTTESSWTLHLPVRGSRPSARMTRDNLAATAPYINFDSPLMSELRIRAIDGHAGKFNALNTRNGVALRAIDSWLEAAQPPGTALSRAKQAYAAEDSGPYPTTPPSIGFNATTRESSSADAVGVERGEEDVAAGNDDPTDPSTSEARPAGRLPQVANPFDPEIFNRRFHR